MRNEPVCGGTTDKTDTKAPKAINSKEITKFNAEFFLFDDWSNDRSGSQYNFIVEKNAEGQLMLSETETGKSVPADEKLLEKVQNVIEEQELAYKNGIYKVTAGLPYEFQPCYLKVDYKSGESISFTENNNPEAYWAIMLHDIFAEWFSMNGESGFLPPAEATQITRIDFVIKDEKTHKEYSGIYVDDEQAIDGEKYLLQRYIYDSEKEDTTSWDFALFPEDYYTKVSEMLKKFDIRPFDPRSSFYGYGRTSKNDAKSDDAKVHFYIVYKNEYVISISVSAENDIELLKPLLDELLVYHDSLFDK